MELSQYIGKWLERPSGKDFYFFTKFENDEGLVFCNGVNIIKNDYIGEIITLYFDRRFQLLLSEIERLKPTTKISTNNRLVIQKVFE